LVFLGATVAKEQVARLDDLAVRDGRSRSGMLRVVLDAGLAAVNATRVAVGAR
jgi:predicted DNA-binding protein